MASTYSFANPRPARPLYTFRLFCGGFPILDEFGAYAEHGSLEAAWDRAWQESGARGVSLEKFSVKRVPL